MKKKRMSNHSILLIILGTLTLIILIIGFTWGWDKVNIFKKKYHIYESNCELDFIGDICNEKIEIENMSIKGLTFLKENLDEQMLDDFCNRLNENTWGCGKYLVIYK